ncbi:DNA-dependent helicase II, partial [Pasteurella multocida subsp. multocida str. Anand1_buffalo]
TECIQEIRLRGTVTRAMNQQKVGSVAPSLQESEWKMGQKVLHSKFGQGTIINVEGAENNTRLQIAFQNQGIKWLIAHLAKLEKIR